MCEGRTPALPPFVAEAVRNDLRQAIALFRTEARGPQSPDTLQAVAFLADRITHTIGLSAGLHHIENEHADTPGPDPQQRWARLTLASLSESYGKDAMSERRATTLLYGLFTILATAAIAVALLGLRRAHRGSQFLFSEYAAYGLVGLALATFAFAAIWQASRHRRSAREAARLQRQLVGFDAYIALMPDPLRDLFRGTMVQQLFPRLLEDDEPWREPQWPSPDSLLEALGSRTDDPSGNGLANSPGAD